MEYNFRAIEKKWQQKWVEDKTYKVAEDKDKKKFYVDFNHDGCYYTEDCIPPSDIEVLIDLENDVWIPLKDFPKTEKYKEIKERIEKETIPFVK